MDRVSLPTILLLCTTLLSIFVVLWWIYKRVQVLSVQDRQPWIPLMSADVEQQLVDGLLEERYTTINVVRMITYAHNAHTLLIEMMIMYTHTPFKITIMYTQYTSVHTIHKRTHAHTHNTHTHNAHTHNAHTQYTHTQYTHTIHTHNTRTQYTHTQYTHTHPNAHTHTHAHAHTHTHTHPVGINKMFLYHTGTMHGANCSVFTP